MFLSEASVRRPIAVSCLIIALALLGLNAYRRMTVEFLPRMDVPIITVRTVYPGATPEQLETDVAKRIEDRMVTLDGLDSVQSTCMENVCLTLLEFKPSVDVDIAATDVREQLDMIRQDLPADAEDPIVQKFDINAMPVVTLALAGDAPLDDLYDYAANTLKDRITVIPGVAECTIIGGAAREVHVSLDRGALAARGLTSLEVAGAIRRSIGRIPSGRIRGDGREYGVEFDADLAAVDDMNGLELRAAEGRRTLLRDVGEAAMSTAEVRQRAFVDGRPCIVIEVIKKADANAVEVVREVQAAMERLRATLPGGMELVWFKDEGSFIEATVRSAWVNVAQGVMLTALVLLVFLHNLRATLVVSLTMPLTVVIGLFWLRFLGYTLNTSTLVSIGLSVGVLVTNSIVVLEAIVTHLQAGKPPREAARRGAAESWVPVLASAGTNVVVLFPIAMIEVIIGQFLRPLVVTMMVMTVVSLFISFTLTPILCMLLLKHVDRERTGFFARLEHAWNDLFERLTQGYGGILRRLERHRIPAALLLAATVLLFLHSFTLAARVGGSFFPKLDKGDVTLRLEFPTTYALDETAARMQEVETRLAGLPEMQRMITTMGKIQGIAGQASEGVYLAQVQIKFSERTERDLPLDDLLAEVRRRMDGFTDCIVGVFIPVAIGGINTDIELYLSGDELEILDRIGLEVKRLAEASPEFSDMDTTIRAGKEKLRLVPRRTVLADLDQAPRDLGMALRGNIEGIKAGTYTSGDRNYDIVVRFADEPGREQIERFLFPGAPGRPLLVDSLAEVQETAMPIQILRRDKRRVCKVTGNSALPLGTAVNWMRHTILTSRLLPPGYDMEFAGEAKRMAEAQAAMGEAGLIALVLVVLTLAAIMESWRQPVLILVTVPLALIGVFWALFLFGESLSVFVTMGIVMLIGIVVNNAILIMDQFNVHLAEGAPRHGAMIRACRERFRPIVMITLAAVLGMLPMGLSRGIGAELRTGVGISSAGGILISGILSLLVLPVLYDFFTRAKGKESRPCTPAAPPEA